jgi:hypothetical protein
MSRAAGHAERLGASSAGVTAPSSHELARRARHPASPAANGGSARPSARDGGHRPKLRRFGPAQARG